MSKKASLWDVLLFAMGRTLCWKNKTFTTTVELQRNERMNFYRFEKILGESLDCCGIGQEKQPTLYIQM